jgi:ubiquinone/menaquinone biosynthesis C-methylase UbiE
MAEVGTPTPEYVLGHSSSEHERLISQSDLIDDLTAEVFRRAGLGKGMRVLDVGSGAGDVAFLAGSVVSRTGSVLGIDRAAESTSRAQKRARSMGLDHVTFQQCDLEAFDLDNPVDALVGRFILMYLPNREHVLRRLLTFVRPGGLVIFHEIQISLARTVPPCPFVDATVARVRETFTRAGFEIDMGAKLLPLFRCVGLQNPKAILAGRIEDEPGTSMHAWLAGMARSLVPAMERLGVATADDLQIETLVARLEAETKTQHGVIIAPPLVGCWATRT